MVGAWVELILVLPDLQEEIKREQGEYNKGEDLEGKTSNHEVVADLEHVTVVISSGSNTTTSSLKHQAVRDC